MSRALVVHAAKAGHTHLRLGEALGGHGARQHLVSHPPVGRPVVVRVQELHGRDTLAGAELAALVHELGQAVLVLEVLAAELQATAPCASREGPLRPVKRVRRAAEPAVSKRAPRPKSRRVVYSHDTLWQTVLPRKHVAASRPDVSCKKCSVRRGTL